MKKNVATKWIVFAFNRSNSAAVTGDAAQITASVYIDGGGANAVDDTNPAELGHGYYIFDITDAECNGDVVIIDPVSSTAGVQVIGCPGAVWTDTLAADLAALPTDADVNAACDTAVSDAALATAANLAAAKSVVDSILTDTGTTLDAKLDTIDGIMDDILTDTGATLDAKLDTIDGIVDAIKAVTDVIGAAPTAADIADAVLGEALAGHVTAGTAGKALADAASAGDPWSTALPGAYGVGTAGKLISDTKIEVDAVLVDTGTTLDGKLNTMQDSLDDILPAAIADAVWDEVVGVHATAGTTGKKLADAAAASTPPTAADIADAVWNEPTVGHTSAGSTGEAILATISAIYPSAVSIAAALWAKIITGAVSAETALATLYNGWTSDAGVGSGAGAISSEITVTVGGVPADGVEAWISTDIGGANVIAGTLITDAFGKVTFMLDAGTYFLWKQKSAVNFTNPETIVVTA